MVGQALAIQEAQARGTPIASTYHDRIPEGMVESVTGQLVPKRNDEEIRATLKRFADEERLAQYARDARAFVESEFDNDDILDQQVELYRDLQADR